MKILHVRRVVAILLLFAMLFSVMPFAAFADDTDIAGEQSEEVVETAEPPTETQAEEPEEDAREISEDEEPVETSPAEEVEEESDVVADYTEDLVYADESETAEDLTETEEATEAPEEPSVTDPPVAEDTPDDLVVAEPAPNEQVPIVEEPEPVEETPIPEAVAVNAEALSANEAAEPNETGESVIVRKTAQIPTNTGNHISQGWNATGVALHYLEGAEREPAYCLNPKRGSTDSAEYLESEEANWNTSEWMENTLSQQQIYAISLAVAYGNKVSNPASNRYEQLAVQLLVWEIVVGQRKASSPFDVAWSYPGENGYTGLFMGTIGLSANKWSQADYNSARNAYDNITAAMAKHYTIPSFAVPRTWADENTPVYTMKLTAQGVYKAVLPEDEHGVLSEFNWSADSVNFSKNGNVLTVTSANRDAVNNVSFTSDPAKVLSHFSPVVYLPKPAESYSHDQPLMVCRGNSDPLYAKFKLKADEAPEMSTTATWQDGSKVAFDFDAKTVLEKCNINGKLPTGSYKMKTVLWDIDGNKAVEEKLSDAFTLTYGESFVFETSFDVTGVKPLPASMVVLEYLYVCKDDGSIENEPILTHDDKADANQTVRTATVQIRTLAQSDKTGKFFNVGVDNKIVDKVFVTIEGDVAEASYTFTATLMEAVENDGSITEKAVMINNQPVTVTKKVTIGPGETTVELEFTGLDWSKVLGKHLVVYEDMDRDSDGKHVTDHKVIEDEGQSVWVPEAHTTALDEYTQTHYTYALPETTTIDRYFYSGLIAGKQYDVVGFMNYVDADGAEHPVLLNGEAVTAVAQFTAESGSGYVDLKFTYPAVALVGLKTVVGETLYYDGNPIHYHYDVNDDEQTVTPLTPSISTFAYNDDLAAAERAREIWEQFYNNANGYDYSVDEENAYIKWFHAGEPCNLREMLRVTNLLPGRYEIDAHVIFMGCVASTNDNGVSIVGPAIIPSDGGYGHIGTIMPGTELASYTWEYSYITTSGDGTAAFVGGPKDIDFDHVFELDSEYFAGAVLVVTEELYMIKDGQRIKIANHSDRDDPAQTVYVLQPELHTTAVEVESNSHTAEPLNEVTIRDTVEYTGLIAGKEYTVYGILMEKYEEDGEVKAREVLVDGEPVVSSATFKAESSNGSVDVLFTFNASGLAGVVTVAFEDLYSGDVYLTSHADIEDKEQTVTFTYPKVGTTATVDGQHWSLARDRVKLVDKVEYEQLIVGKEYKLVATLYKVKMVNGKPEFGEKLGEVTDTFVCEFPMGYHEMIFYFNASKLGGCNVVVAEELWSGDTLIATHTNPGDKNQTVEIKPDSPPTGDDNNLGLWIGVLGGSLLCLAGAVYMVVKRRKYSNGGD